MKKYLYIIAITLLVCSSCKKFLDVQPESDITKEQLFNTEDGFKEALNGVYNYCAGKDLYGDDLTFKNLELMAQNYAPGNVSYKNIQSFLYADAGVIGDNDGLWSHGYRAIGYCNAILEAIDAKKDVFSGRNYDLVKGEALTLRAYLHFDMLRLFAPSYKNNPAAKAIPYVTTVTINSTPFATTTEILDKIIADLTAAKALLKSDPILSSGYVVGYPNKTYAGTVAEKDKATEVSSGDIFIQNRRHRMNYYAACGELARVYLYKEDFAKSLENADEVINAKKFPWTTKEDFFNPFSNQRDRIFYPELIAGWYIPDSKKMLEEYFTQENAAFSPLVSQKDIIFERGTVGADDWRWMMWFTDVLSSNSPSRAYLRKFGVNPDEVGNAHPLMAPAIRLSEMYYIAAEASFDTDKAKAITYFNTVREHRGIGDGLPASIDKTEFLDKLVAECRKEFFAEGQ
ncbi:MAG TPA: RagB/SusD family nutrient uptake outer membrane protein, partial [Pedobacter sp.]